MSNTTSMGPGRGKPNTGYNPEQHTGAAPGYQPRMPPNQMQHQYQPQQQPTYQPQYNQYNHYQQPPQMYQQQYGYVPQQPQMYNQNYPYQGPSQHYPRNDTVTFPQTQTNLAPQEPKRQRKLLEIVDPNTKKAIEVTPHHVPATVVPAAPVVPLGPADEEKTKLDLGGDFSEQVRKRLASITTEEQAAAAIAPDGLPNFSEPSPVIVQNVAPAPKLSPPTPVTPEAPKAAKEETTAPQPEHVTHSDPTNSSGNAESAVDGHEVQKEESKKEVNEPQIEKTPEELEKEKAQKEAEEKEKKRKSLMKKVDELVQSGATANGMFIREFMMTIREIEKLFSHTPCPLSPNQLADFGLDVKTMRVAENKKANFKPQWMPNTQGSRQTNNPYRGRATTDGTGRGAQHPRNNRRPPVARASIERVRVALASSENAWKPDRQKASDNIPEDEAAIKEVCKKVRALMNKVTPTSQGPLTQEFISYQVSTNENQLAQVVGIVFDKAVEEPKFCALYAEMCKAQVDHEVQSPENNGRSAFRNAILTKTQAFFQDKRDIDADKLAFIEKEEDPVKREAMIIEEKQKFRRRKFGVMKLIGYLYRNTLLTTRILQQCSAELFTSILPKKVDDKEQPLKKEDIDEESIHCGLQLIETVGDMLDDPKERLGKVFLDQWIEKLKLAKPVCSNKIRFMIMNLDELRQAKWIPRKSRESGPKKIDEIHRDIRMERIENERVREQYDRNRPHGRGGRQNR